MTPLSRWREQRQRHGPQAPLLMGVLNVTPDSFYDGGRHAGFEAARRHAEQLATEGAAYLDVGGESTRPGAAPVSELQELERTIPLIEAIRAELDVAVSVDTSRPVVMREAVAAGAILINDVRALSADGALATAASTGADVCVMHMQGQPDTMQRAPSYNDVVGEVLRFLLERRNACEGAGIDASRVVLDPGIGFGKQLRHNLALLKAMPGWCADGHGLLIGVSRKSMLGELTGQPAERRLYPSLAVAMKAADAGVAILRVHDVEATREVLTVWQALRSDNKQE